MLQQMKKKKLSILDVLIWCDTHPERATNKGVVNIFNFDCWRGSKGLLRG
jgi:hypothetical protein